MLHDLTYFKVQYVPSVDRFLMVFFDGSELWTNSFSVVRETYEKMGSENTFRDKEKKPLQMELF